MPCAVLIIDDEPTLARNMAVFLERHGHDARVTHSGEEGLALYPQFRPDVVLLDHNLPGMDGLEVLRRLRTLDPQVKVVMVTGFGSVEVAVRAMKLGAADYLSKPVSLNALQLLLDRLAGQTRLEQTVEYFQQRQATRSGMESLIGASESMQALRARIHRLLDAEQQLADAEPPAVLIQGETGTGKELVARALHFGGPRRAQPFVELNCGALPAQLVEAELFGYEKGAFTDARQRKPGLVETAEGGTLFLDEIGEADASTQVKLLKLLEDKRFRRLGGLRDQSVNVRIISATHQPLEQRVREGRFRADLFFRLRIVDIGVPALRERGADILTLARHFLALHSRRYRRGPMTLSPQAEHALRHHPWPGNVRELRNAIEQAVLLSSGSEISSRELGSITSVADPRAVPPQPSPGATTTAMAEPTDLHLERTERRLIETALQRTDGNVTQAARLLGISRDTLRYRLDRLGLRPPDPDERGG
jgi:two-component system, NtrC family, response regulator AtoC